MKLQTFLPLITYPDSNSEAVAANATCVAALLDADLTVLAVNVHIQKVSSPLSKLLLDVPDMIRKSEADSRHRAEICRPKSSRKLASGGFPSMRARYTRRSPSSARLPRRPHGTTTCRWSAGRPEIRRLG